MMSIKLTIDNPVGLHARPAALFAQTAQKYSSMVSITYGERTVNAKSILNLLTLGVSQGTEILVTAQGVDEELALEGLRSLIQNDFEG